MLTRYQDAFQETFSLLDQLFGDELFGARNPRGLDRWPRFEVEHADGALTIRGELPGFSREDLKLELHEGELTIEGERKLAPPEGYKVVRKERAPMRFSRRYALPEQLAVDQAEAELKDGVLTLRIPERPKAAPRKIQINS